LNPFLKKFLSLSRRTTRVGMREATAAIQRALRAQRVAARASTPVPSKRPASTAVPRAATATATASSTATAFAEPASQRPTPSRPPSATATAERVTEGRFTEDSFTAAAGTRLYKLFEPSGFAGPRPLVLMLHGCTQNPDDFAAGTRMNELAESEGFFVLYPAQAPRSNASKCWNWFVPADQRRGHGEPAYLAALIRHIAATRPIDPDRIYVAGLSAGGAMAAILAREYPEIFAAAGVHSGLPPGAAHDVGSAFAAMKSGVLAPAPATWPGPLTAQMAGGLPLRTPLAAWPSAMPLATPPADERAETETGRSGARGGAETGAPVIVFHGDGDKTVHPINGDHVVDAVLGPATWEASRQQVPAQAGQRAYTRVVYQHSGGGADGASRAESWLVQGAGHAWSGGSTTGSYTDAAGPDASREMLRFFLAHPRRRDG